MLTTLQCFDTYLKTTENWSYHLIRNLPDTDCLVAARRFEKCNFYEPRFTYLEFPLRRAEPAVDGWLARRYERWTGTLQRLLYHGYVARRAGGVDLVHSHFAHVGWEYSSLARRLGVPHVVSFYGFDYESLPHKAPRWAARYAQLFRDADLFLCEGEHGVRILRDRGCPADKLAVSPLGVDTRRIPCLPRRKKPGELRLVQVASLTAKKGHEDTVRAFLAALPGCPEMTLTIVGGDSGGTKAALLRTIPPELVGTRIVFVDRVEFARLHEFLGEQQVFIHPSRYAEDRDCEGGAPVVLLDAQASGLPVLATRHCDIPAVVVDGRTGVLVAERDWQALAAAIVRFYAMGQAEFDEFARAGRSHIERHYDIVANAAHLAGIYRRLLESRGRRRGRGERQGEGAG